MKNLLPLIIGLLCLFSNQRIYAQATQTTTTVVQISNIYDENTDPYNKFMSQRRDTFIYNTKHLLTAEHAWASDNYDSVLTDSGMHTYVYNASNKLICQTQLYWKSNTKTYLPNLLDSFSYDTKANTLTHTYYQWQGTKFQPSQKEIHQMNAKGQDTTLIFQQYLIQSNSTYQWETINRNYFTYNASGKLIRNMGYVWAPGGGKRQPASREDLIYNSAGQLVQDIDSFVDNGVSYTPESRQYYYYNKTTGLLDSSMYQLFSQYPNNIFINWKLYLYKYSSKYTGYVSQMTEKQWDTGKSIWLDNYRHTYTYSSYTVNSSDVLSATEASINLQLYPNPVHNGNLNLNISENGNNSTYEVNISDISGKVVYQSKCIGGSQKLVVESLLPGVYFLSLHSSNGVVVRKFVRE